MKRMNIYAKRIIIAAVNLFLVSTLIVVSVYSWFTSNHSLDATMSGITVTSGSDIELSLDGVSWGCSLDLAELKAADGSKVFDSLKFSEITGDGEIFKIPVLTEQSGYAEVDTAASWPTAEKNKDYLEFTVYMRSMEKFDVYLGAMSYAEPQASVLTGTGCENVSPYSDGANTFSKDLIAGAVRVAFNNAADTRCVWIPKPQYHLNNKVGSSDYSVDISAVEGYYSDGTGTVGGDFAWNDPYKHYYYSGTTLSEYQNTLTSLVRNGTDTTRLVSLNTKSGGYYTASVTFRVWIEGCDTEARRALMDGKFDISFVFETSAVDENG